MLEEEIEKARNDEPRILGIVEGLLIQATLYREAIEAGNLKQTIRKLVDLAAVMREMDTPTMESVLVHVLLELEEHRAGVR